MRSTSVIRSTVALVVIAASFAVSPAGAAPVTGAGRRATLYLHSETPSGSAEQARLQADPNQRGPWMDEAPPTDPAPKSTLDTAAGNQNFRKNFLVGFWSAAVHGHVTNAHVNVWVATRSETITVTLFGDGGIGSGIPAARAEGRRAVSGSTLFQADIPVDAHVDEELVLSVSTGDTPAAVIYDGLLYPSSLAFDIDVYDPPAFGADFPPATGWNAVQAVSVRKAARESSLAVNPVNESEMLVCDPSGVPNTAEGHSYFHVSRDGGSSWSELEVEPVGDPRENAFEGGDCDVAYDATGTIYTADTWLGNLSVGASRDGGATWSGTPIAVQAPIVDRPWLVGGPPGTVYLTYQDLQFAMPSAIWFLRSTDYGQTFSVGVPITTASADGTHTWTGNFAVSPSGQDIYSVYTRRGAASVLGDLDDAGPETIWVASSHDAGATWTQNLVATMTTPASYLYPSIAMDAGGALHVVFSSKRENDRPVWYSTSTDQARTWTSPVALTSGTSGFAPWVAGGGPGEAAVIWYGSPDPKANVAAGKADWYLYWARVSGGGATVTSGTTTVRPLFHGVAAMPEFNQVRLDSNGKMRIGASVYAGSGEWGGWVAYYQQES